MDRNPVPANSFKYFVGRSPQGDRGKKFLAFPAFVPFPALSLSARRAWIEIRQGLVYAVLVGVALRKESVDRNVWVDFFQRFHYSRSPQGERG